MQYHFKSSIAYMRGNEEIPEVNDGICYILLSEAYKSSLDQKY
jgi:hypothetical protein